MSKFLIPFLLLLPVLTFGQKDLPRAKDLKETWIKLERDSMGYLIYEPCNGNTPAITIDSGVLTIYWQLDGPSKYKIREIARINNDRTLSFTSNTEDKSEIVFDILIKDDKKRIVLWSFSGIKWVMTPSRYKDEFRHIDNKCHGEMKPEKQFLPIEF